MLFILCYLKNRLFSIKHNECESGLVQVSICSFFFIINYLLIDDVIIGIIVINCVGFAM